MMIDKSRHNSVDGFTLIEVILYLALFGMIFLVMVQFFFFISDSNQLSGETLKLDRSEMYLSQHFEDSFNKTNTVAETGEDATIFDGSCSSTGRLTLIYPNDDTVTYDVSNSKLVFGLNNITRGDVEVEKFCLERIVDKSDTIVGVRITIGIRSISENNVYREFTNSYFFE